MLIYFRPARTFFKYQLAVYSALSCLTDLGIYYITRCGIWLLTTFDIQETEKGDITKIIPFFFLSVLVSGWHSLKLSLHF